MADARAEHPRRFARVLLLSIDGLHALDLANYVAQYPHSTLAALSHRGVTFTQASAARPSDSFPGLLAIVTGGSPNTTGVWYDDSYDRSLSPPASDCTTVGTEVVYNEAIDQDLMQLDGGGGIDPAKLPRDPQQGCRPVFPHQYLRVNTLFEVIKQAGGSTAWADKHPAYEILQGPSGTGLDDFYGPEINSRVVPLPAVPGCDPVPDPTATDAWTSSFQNIQCYDQLKVQAILHQIAGTTHDGTAMARVPTVFGMNFQAVSVGQKLVEASLEITGGYLDAFGTSSPALLNELTFVDTALGEIVQALKDRQLYDSTLIIVTAKHGQAPIDPSKLQTKKTGILDPGDVVAALPGHPLAQATEDDIALLWLSDQRRTTEAAAALLRQQEALGASKIYAVQVLELPFNSPDADPRVPDLIVQPNLGVIYTSSTKKIAEHGGFSDDDTNVALLVSGKGLRGQTLKTPVQTAQIAPTILGVLGLDPTALQAVRREQTPVLPGIGASADE
jgi:hypothetical protein